MQVINYNPEIIEKEYSELAERVQKENKTIDKHNKIVETFGFGFAIIMLAALVFLIVMICTNRITDTRIWIGVGVLVGSGIAWVMFCHLGEENAFIEEEETFAMRYHKAVKGQNVIDVVLFEDPENNKLFQKVVVVSENTNHVVAKTDIRGVKVAQRTDITECVLDVEAGYAYVPYL